MRYYKKDGKIVDCIIENNVPLNAMTGETITEIEYTRMWTTQEAAANWQRTERHTRLIIDQVPGAVRHMSPPNLIWLIPAGSERPTGEPGRPKR